MTQKYHWNSSFYSTKKVNFDLSMTVRNGTHVLVIGTVHARIKGFSNRLQHFGGNIDENIYIATC